jgi:glycosyltransferase involved in cell wall biosynthesis
MSRRFVDALQEFRESERYTKGMYSWVGFKKKEILYDRDPRAAGTTKWNYTKLVNLAIDGITSFTTAPLRLSTYVGALVSAIAFIYILYLLIRPLFGVPTVPGYASTLAVILFLGGVQLLSLGIIGEYVGRIFNETKRRPLYFVEEYHEAHHEK